MNILADGSNMTAGQERALIIFLAVSLVGVLIWLALGGDDD